VRRSGGEATEGADVGLEAAVHRQAAPVAVVDRQERRLLVVTPCVDRSRHRRVAAVRADHHGGALAHDHAVLRALNADDAAVLHQNPVDGEALAHLGARFGRGVEQQLVEHGAARTVGDGGIRRSRRSFYGDRAEVERIGMNRRAARREKPVEQPPPGERRDGARVDDVGRRGVARERRAIHEQDSIALARKQHRGGRSRAAGADNDDVVGLTHERPPLHPALVKRRDRS
jgi:hypothetical protein